MIVLGFFNKRYILHLQKIKDIYYTFFPLNTWLVIYFSIKESTFSTGGRVLDSFRTSLTPKMVEALVCGQDWMRTSRTHFPVEENLLELEAMALEEG